MHVVIRMTALFQDKKKEQYLKRYCESGLRPAFCHGQSVFFMGNGSIKLLDLNQVITVLNRNVTESNFTNFCLITFKNTEILKGPVTTVTA